MTAMSVQDRLTQARGLAVAGGVAEAIALLQAAPADQAPATWTVLAQLLRAEDRLEEALAIRLAQVEAKPGPANHHNVAALLGDMGRAVEAEAAVRRAFAAGGDAPETWLVLARALTGQGRHDEAEAAFREAMSRRPAMVEALTDLSQLIWMRTGDVAQALAPVDAALETFPDLAPLHGVRAKLKRFAGIAPEAIYRDLTTAPLAATGALDLPAAHAALEFDRDRALVHGRAAVARAPSDLHAVLQLAEIHLARDEGRAALDFLDPILAHAPFDQQTLALRNTAWRLLDDPRALGAEDYAAVVGGYVIDTPEGWPSLDAYLADLAVSLRGLHRLKTHPIGQSLRHGTQTSVDLRFSADPAIHAFFAAIDRPIREHMRGLGQGTDPLRSRNTGEYRLAGCWSVQLQPGGYHTPHFHSKGWLSSACHIDLPASIDSGHEGWLAFGSPAFDGARPLPPEHYEKPAPGRLVLFPSCLWHGTIPFSGTQTRLTVAFDVVPA